MSKPTGRIVVTPRGPFRVLYWAGRSGPPVLLLHGLTATADAWRATIRALGDELPPRFAIDLRGHGQSHAPDGDDYSAATMAKDVVAVMAALGLDRPHLAGHSMGARIAMVAAARMPGEFRSVSIVDIGPERWTANWRETVAAIDRMAPWFADEESAVAALSRGRELSTDAHAALSGRFQPAPGGGVAWRGSREGWKAAVIAQRSRDFWREWERITIPALLVRGGTSTELRAATAEEMRKRNARVAFEEFEGIGHNIPAIAPARLGASLQRFWAMC